MRRQTIKNRTRATLMGMNKRALEIIQEGLDNGDMDTALHIMTWTQPKPKPINDEKIVLSKAISSTLEERTEAVIQEMLAGKISIETAESILRTLTIGKPVALQLSPDIRSFEDFYVTKPGA